MTVNISRQRKLFLWLAAIAVLAAAIILVPYYLGVRHWENVQSELSKRGEHLFSETFIKQPIPDSENFYAIPYFREARDRGRGTRIQADALKTGIDIKILDELEGLDESPASEERKQAVLRKIRDSLEPWRDLRNEVIAAAKRPNSNADLKLSDGTGTRMSHVEPSLRLTNLLRLDATVALEENRIPDAYEDFTAVLKLASASAAEPTLISQLVAYAMSGAAEFIVRDGLQKWTPEQLKLIDGKLNELPFSGKALADAYRSDRAVNNETYRELLQHGIPAGTLPIFRHYLYPSWANYNLAMQELIDTVETREPQPKDIDPFDVRIRSFRGLDRWLHMLESVSMPGIKGAYFKLAFYRDQTQFTRLAIALELWRREHGEYPDSLSLLVPAQISAIPNAFLPNQSIQYRKLDSKNYRLWTFGWDETDQGGVREKLFSKTGDWAFELLKVK